MAADLDRLTHFAARVELIRANLSQRELARFADQMAKEMRESNAKRIKANVTPEGDQMDPRKPQRGNREIKFIYTTSDNEVRHLKSWRGTRSYIIGFDIMRGGIRTFKRSRIKRFIKVDANKGDAINKSKIKRKMFSRLIKSKWLKAKGYSDRAEVSFASTAEKVAHIHHYGLKDKGSKGQDIQYPERPLLGMDAKDIDKVEDLLLTQLTKGL
ncbi:phage virion morphogenesis protein [Aeromonas salmonicida]|uniref:phage virion morphogenesis protein n=1 Tax=Aeromonas salmonicida TaxID=645 RepID=UPI001C62C2CE|nr:phage virion morphogenesis protein [Aeromonas salmonicida]QYH27433.1 phage virion morphogenesis protein [Aeromonas salmonicida subsp. masoucida]QYH31722.1 phage virion morphogenesis protein [Aeromonas salmonicida subsp. masoucida]